MTPMNRSVFILSLALSLSSYAFQACSQKANNTKTKDTASAPSTAATTLPYQLDQGALTELPEELQEISGITFLPDNKEWIYAIQDEKGLLYSYNLINKQLSSVPFEKDGDYEDLAVSNSHFIILKSNGTLYTFPITEKNNIQQVKTFKDLLPKGEYEGLATDPARGLVFALCKSCSADKKKAQTSGYIFKINERGDLEANGGFTLNIEQLKQVDHSFSNTFKPSALTKRVSTNEWYILSSVDKVLVITDDKWNVKSVSPLSRKQHAQPEGIAFDADDNLYISNEAGNKDKAILYKFELLK
ncbi:SdiA-regulated domain-containing protein [Sphingobacterium spiritivorum]|nr:SdiA-regulated domain-containing protein [Sphingobacterium spiritivorum]